MQKKPFSACNDWIIVERKKGGKEVQKGVIAVIEDRTQYEGVILSIGKDADLEAGPGDTVIWGKWEGTSLLVGGCEVTAIRCSDAILVARVK